MSLSPKWLIYKGIFVKINFCEKEKSCLLEEDVALAPGVAPLNANHSHFD
jgi:hypothetical protein